MIAQALNAEAAALYEYGRDRGSNVHLIACSGRRRTDARHHRNKERGMIGTIAATNEDEKLGL